MRSPTRFLFLDSEGKQNRRNQSGKGAAAAALLSRDWDRLSVSNGGEDYVSMVDPLKNIAAAKCQRDATRVLRSCRRMASIS